MSTTAAGPIAASLPEAPVWRGAMYRALALALSYPDAASVEQLAVDLDDLIEHPLTAERKLFAATAALREAIREADAPTLGARYHDLFDGEVACSPYETEYEFDAFAKARQLADIAGFYRAFGLKAAADDAAAPADFVATEMEFLSHLALKLALAEAEGEDERVAVTREALRAFIEDHPGQWLPLFCRTLVSLEDVDAFYGAAACLCDAFMQAEIELVGARPRPAMVRRASREMEEVLTCPMAAPDDEHEEELA